MTTIQRAGQKEGRVQLGIIDWAIVITLLTGIFTSVGLLLRQEHRLTLMENSIANAAHDAAVASAEAKQVAVSAAAEEADHVRRIERLERKVGIRR